MENSTPNNKNKPKDYQNKFDKKNPNKIVERFVVGNTEFALRESIPEEDRGYIKSLLIRIGISTIIPLLFACTQTMESEKPKENVLVDICLSQISKGICTDICQTIELCNKNLQSNKQDVK